MVFVAIVIFSYFVIHLFREATKRKNPILEFITGTFLGINLLLNAVLTDYFYRDRLVSEGFWYFWRVVDTYQLPVFIGWILRAVKYRFFEKGVQNDICPKCGALERRKHSEFCWYCGSEMLKKNRKI